MPEFNGGLVAGGQPDKISVAQIWNPPDSGVDFVVDYMELAWTVMGSTYRWLQSSVAQDIPTPYQGFDLNWFDSPLTGPDNRRLLPVRGSMAASSCPIELQHDNWSTPYLPSKLFREAWKQQVGDMKPIPFHRKPIIPPGLGLLVRAAHNYTWTIVNVEGCTVPAAVIE